MCNPSLPLKRRLTLLFSLTLLLFEVAMAGMYRWVDQNGKVQYSDVMPTNQAGQGHAELDKQGRVVKEIRRSTMTPEERQRRNEAAQRQEEVKRKQIEQERHDMALLSTYANVNEIALARDRAIELENLNIRGLQTRMDRAAEKLAEANAQISRFRRSGKPAPSSYAQMRDEAQNELARISAAMNQRLKAVDDIRQRFQENEKRFLELKAR